MKGSHDRRITRAPRRDQGYPRQAGVIRYHQPELQYSDHRLHRGLPRVARRDGDAGSGRDGREELAVRDDRAGGRGGHRSVRAYRCRAGRWPGLGNRSVPDGGEGRQAVRAGHVRHEGVPRLCPGEGAGLQGAGAQDADPRGVLLRRGGRLHGREADDRRDGQDDRQAEDGDRRRADDDDGGRCPQGAGALERGRHGPAGAFEPGAARRQFDRGRGGADRRTRADRAGPQDGAL